MAEITLEVTSLDDYINQLRERRRIRDLMKEDNLNAFRNAFSSKKRKPDISRASKFTNKVKTFTADQLDSLISQLDTLSLGKYDNEIVKAFFQDMNENKKIKVADALSLAKFAIELIRRYPSTVEMFESEFTAIFTECKTKPSQPINRLIFFVYCELCLCGCVGKENVIGRLFRILMDHPENESFSVLLITFSIQYGYEFIGVYPQFLLNPLLVKEKMSEFSPIVLPSLQSRFLTMFTTYFSSIQKEGDATWSKYSELRRTAFHQETLRGDVSSELSAELDSTKKKMDILKNKIHLLSTALNVEEPQYLEENIRIRSGFESLTVLIPNKEYTGPFANEKEHLFYTNIPNLSQFTQSPSKQNTKSFMNIEKELSVLEDEDDLDEGIVPFGSSSESEDETTESSEHDFINQILTLSSAEEVDQWCLSFCSANTPANQANLFLTIKRNYIRHPELQPYFARLIREITPVFEALRDSIRECLIKRFIGEVRYGKGTTSYRLEAVVRFIVELVRMQCISPSIFFFCLHRLWRDRTFHHLQMIALFVELLGPLMLYLEELQGIMNKELEHIKNICTSNVLSTDSNTILMNAYYTCRPDERPKIKKAEIPPLQLFLRFLLGEKLEPDTSSSKVHSIACTILKYNIDDDQTLILIVQEILRTCQYSTPSIDRLAVLSTELAHYSPRFGCILLDMIFERIFHFLDTTSEQDMQEMMSIINFVSNIFIYSLIDEQLIFSIMYLFIEYGHTVTPKTREWCVFLPSRPLVAYPLVPYKQDMPSNFLRLKLVIALARKCGSYLEEDALDEFVTYLQSYFLSKDNVDVDTFFEYQQFLKECAVVSYNTFEDADAAVAALEALASAEASAKASNETTSLESSSFDHDNLKLHSTLYVTDERVSDEEVADQRPVLRSASEVHPVVKDEDELILEKKYNDRMKGGQTAISNRRVNLDNMVIPMNLQAPQELQSGARLLFKGKNGVGVGVINMHMSEDERERVEQEVREKRNDRRRLKQKTIHLNQIQGEDGVTIQQIRNDRTLVSSQTYQRK